MIFSNHQGFTNCRPFQSSFSYNSCLTTTSLHRRQLWFQQMTLKSLQCPLLEPGIIPAVCC